MCQYRKIELALNLTLHRGSIGFNLRIVYIAIAILVTMSMPDLGDLYTPF
jgi:hypothetical protein